jgi:hypothetical protein
VLNNPIQFNDPSGNKYCDSDDSEDCTRHSNSIEDTLRKYRIRLKGDGWNSHVSEQLAVVGALDKVGLKFASERAGSSSQAFVAVYGHMTLQWEGGVGICGDPNKPVDSGGCTDNSHQIRFWSMSGHGQNDISRMMKNIVHEFGHAYDNILGSPSGDMSPDFTRNTLLRPNQKTELGTRWGWQQSPDTASNEVFADMFIAWTYNAWNNDPANATTVGDAQNWMNGLVP